MYYSFPFYRVSFIFICSFLNRTHISVILGILKKYFLLRCFE